MALKKKGGLAVLHRHYDKVIVVVILIGLLVSLLYLSQSARKVQDDADRFDLDLSSLTPRFPKADPVDPAPFEKAQTLLASPFQMQDATNRPFVVAQERVWCVECRRPIQFDATVCPFCQKPQPGPNEGSGWDSDNDTIPDRDEVRYGMNPLDPSDVNHDADGDGFTNLEEHTAGTSLQDPKSHPPRIAFLRIKTIAALPLPIILRGSTRGADGNIRYQINDRSTRQTHFNVMEGQPIGKTGYILKKGSVLKVMQRVEGYVEPREVEIPIITVQREGGRTIELQLDTPTEGDYIVTFICTKDRAETDYIGRPDETFMFDAEAFEVIKIDTAKQTVVIRRVSDKEEIVVPKN